MTSETVVLHHEAPAPLPDPLRYPNHFLALLALLAAACDRLISGGGRYPWLAVAGIYAIPVGWNLVVIAQHTGPHVAPGIVYALVAIVCVWQTVIAPGRYRRGVS